MPELKLVEGWSAPIDETLSATVNGVATPVDLINSIVTLLLQRADGSAVNTTGNVVVPSPNDGQVRYTPDPTDLLAADTPHVARWKVVDGAGKVTYFPNAIGEVWEVQPASPVPLQDNALLTIAECKAALQIKGTDQDLVVADFINACSDGLETLTGRRLKSRTYTDEYVYVRADRVAGDGREWLDVESPITALTSLDIAGTAQTVWVPGDVGSPVARDVFVLGGRDPKHDRDRLCRTAGWTAGTLVRRTYTAGYGPTGFPIPADLKQGVIALAVDWYYRRTRQAEPVISRSAGAETITYVNEQLPRSLAPLLNAYRRW